MTGNVHPKRVALQLQAMQDASAGDKSLRRPPRCSVEQGEAHVVVLLLLGLLLGGLLGLLLGVAATTARGRGRCGESVGVLQHLLDLVQLGERVALDVESEAQHVLEAVDDKVGHRSLGGVVGGEGHGGDIGETGLHDLQHVLVGDVQHVGAVHAAALVHLLDLKAVREGLDAQLSQQGGLGGAHLLAGLHQLHVRRNFDRTLVNLGGNVQGLEEVGRRGVEASVAGRHSDVNGSDKTHTRRSTDLVGLDQLAGLVEVTLGEHHADVADQVGQDVGPPIVTGLLHIDADGALHHGVLTHQHRGVATETRADVHELLGADIVGVHQERLLVLLQITAQLGVIRLLLLDLAHCVDALSNSCKVLAKRASDSTTPAGRLEGKL
mmetsp:Transcript_11374/g.34183  ORF Transcript_11374/g.34183 Transcript_11374/m.34183 type:complete len:380 (-) Transcript_11374:27-1166(-)